MKGIIQFIERNIRGMLVMYGINGIQQFYGYTKAQAMTKYLENCKGKVFINE